MSKTKTLDCVEMKRRGAEALRQRLAGKTPQEEAEYWRRRSEEFAQEQDRLRAQRLASQSPPKPHGS